jgi:hypothetical protein
MVCRILPRFDFEGINYTIDLRLGEFRETEKPYINIKFDSEQGQRMCKYTGIIQCFNCNKWIVIPVQADSDMARCVYCGVYADCD